MSDKFLGTGGGGNANISNGTANIYAASLGAVNLEPSKALKTNSVKQLISSNLEIADINNLQSELNEKDEITFIEDDTHTTPTVGKNKIYFKTDGKFYKKDDTGTETLLGGITTTNAPVVDNSVVFYDGASGGLVKYVNGIKYDSVNNTLEVNDLETADTFSLNGEIQKISNITSATQNPNITVFDGEIDVKKIKSASHNAELEFDNTDCNLTADGNITILTASGDIQLNGNSISALGPSFTFNGNGVLTTADGNLGDLTTKTQNQTATANVTTFDNSISTTYINEQSAGSLRIGLSSSGMGLHSTCYTRDLLPNVGDTRNIGSTPVNHYNAGYINHIFTTSINAGGGLISNLSDPSADQDAATKKYVVDTVAPLVTKTQNITADATSTTINQNLILTAFARYQGFDYSAPPGINTLAPVDYVNTVGNSKLALAGGTMTGVLNMGSNKITGLDGPTLAQDAVNKTYVDDKITPLETKTQNISPLTTAGDTKYSGNHMFYVGSLPSPDFFSINFGQPGDAFSTRLFDVVNNNVNTYATLNTSNILPDLNVSRDIGSLSNKYNNIWSSISHQTSALTNIVDTETATTLQIAPTTATKIDLSKAGITTDIKGDLITNGNVQMNGSTVQIQNSGTCQIQPTGALTINAFNKYNNATLPLASSNEGQIVYLTDEKRMAFSDGVEWCRLLQAVIQDLTPAMTADNTYDANGFKITVSSYYDDGNLTFEGYKAFNKIPYKGQTSGTYDVNNGFTTADNSFNSSGIPVTIRNKFGANVAQEWLQMEMPTIKTVTSITLKWRGDTVYQYAPKDFKFFVSTDDITWTEVQNVTGYSVTSVFQETTYNIGSRAKYIGMSIRASNFNLCIVGELFIEGY